MKKALGNDIRYNGHGAFIINGGSNDLNANVASTPYVQNTVDNLGRPGVANALVNNVEMKRTSIMTSLYLLFFRMINHP